VQHKGAQEKKKKGNEPATKAKKKSNEPTKRALFTLVRSNLYKIKDFYHVTNVGASSPKAHLEPMTILHVVHN